MRLLAIILLLCLLTGTVTALSFPLPATLFSPPATTNLVPVSSFEGGQRFSAGDYPVIVLSGSYRQMGRQYGGLMKTELNEEYTFILSSLQKGGYTQEADACHGTGGSVSVSAAAQGGLHRHGRDLGTRGPMMSSVLYNGAILSIILPQVQSSCSYLAVWGNYTTDGSVVASRNWDLDDVMLRSTNGTSLPCTGPLTAAMASQRSAPPGCGPRHS